MQCCIAWLLWCCCVVVCALVVNVIVFCRWFLFERCRMLFFCACYACVRGCVWLCVLCDIFCDDVFLMCVDVFCVSAF